MGKQVARSNILKLEAAMQAMEGYDPEGKEICRITHYHAPGLYGREMWMPAGCLITGKIHKTEHICVLSKGKVTVANGGDSVTYEAPATIISKVGAKRAIYAHEESVWTNFHATELDDPEEIEADIIAESFAEVDGLLARDDYERFLVEFGVTEDDVQAATHSVPVRALVSDVLSVRESQIHGLGLFVSGKVDEGSIIARALLNGEKTDAGRYTNHSGTPNAKFVIVDEENIDLVAIRQIRDEEVTTDYRSNLTAQGLKRIS
jgi:hypothetical protein